MKVPSHTSLSALDWIPRRQAAGLEKLGILTLRELVENYPRRHEDRRRFAQFPDREQENPLCLCGVVTKTSMRRFGRGKQIFDVLLEEDSGGVLSPTLTCRWFHAHYVSRMIVAGQRLVIFGRPKLRRQTVVMEHPEFEVIDEAEGPSIHFDRIVPVHPSGEGVPPRVMRGLIYRALEVINPDSLPLLLPSENGKEGSRLPLLKAFHFPESEEAMRKAKRLLSLEEFFLLRLLIEDRRKKVSLLSGTSRKSEGNYVRELRKNLPFQLTTAQDRVIREIRTDLEQPRPMHRLLQGDVGSGKTLVALAAMLLAVESGCQAAMMAPTQILAEQHYRNFQNLLKPFPLRLALKTGGKRESDALELWTGEGEPHIVVGTHALLFEKEDLSHLGLVVIDEQHKFGVLQRARLLAKGQAPDLLVMTATPIPRTLALTVYGDLDVSVLDERPQGRGRMITGVRDQKKLPEATAFLKEQIVKGRQGYVVYPLIEESEKLSVRAAEKEFDRWEEMLKPYRCELLHGRTPADQKDAIMRRFRKNETQVLIATTVIEVGVDVPNASVMLIENAERFGLAQLHQLRGRIGRGAHTSYCVLLVGENAEEARLKLKVLETTTDGFEIAEADLRLRGAGDILGTAQSGLPPIRLGDMFRDTDLMDRAARLADTVLSEDPFLNLPKNAHRKRFLQMQEEPATRSG